MQIDVGNMVRVIKIIGESDRYGYLIGKIGKVISFNKCTIPIEVDFGDDYCLFFEEELEKVNKD